MVKEVLKTTSLVFFRHDFHRTQVLIDMLIVMSRGKKGTKMAEVLAPESGHNAVT